MKAEPLTTSKRLIRNTLGNIIMRLSSAVVSFLLIRFFLVHLGEERYGVWLLVASIFNYRGLLSMGLNSSINRYIPVYLAEDNRQGIRKVINTALFTFLAMSVVLATATLIIYLNLNRWFVIDAGSSEAAGLLVIIVGLCFSLAMPLQLSSAVLSGLQRYEIMNVIELIVLISRTSLVVVLLLMDYGLISIGIMFGFSEVAVRLLQFAFVRKLVPDFSISWKYVDFKLLKSMTSYGINTLLYSMGAIIIYKASDIIIGIFMSAEYITRFYIATAVLLTLSQLIQTGTAAIKPAASDLDARNDSLRLREMAFLTQKYNLLLIIPSIAFLMLLGREFLTVWVGSKFSPEVIQELALILAIVAVGHALKLAQHSNFVVLVGKGEHRFFGITTILMALLCVALSIISVTVYNAGLVGIAWANSIPMIIICGLVLPIYFNWKMQISMKDVISQSWFPALIGSIPGLILMIAWKYWYPPHGWAGILMVIGSVGFVTIVSSWGLSLKSKERMRFMKMLPKFSKICQTV